MLNAVFSLLLAILCWVGAGQIALAQPVTETLPIETVDVEGVGDLREKAFDATNTGDFAAAEGYWTKILALIPDNPAVWSNRGNSRVSQNKLAEAIADYNKAIELSPEAPDPYLNRGAALEGLQRWDEAIADYNQVLALDPNDPAAFNNRGNAEAGKGEWDQALTDYLKAADMAPDFAFARANYAIALYQTGQTATPFAP